MFSTPYPYLYYGVSVGAWKNLFSEHGYQFITVESNGVNAFFINPIEFKKKFGDTVQKMEFKENIHQLRLFRTGWNGQFDLIKNLPCCYYE